MPTLVDYNKFSEKYQKLSVKKSEINAKMNILKERMKNSMKEEKKSTVSTKFATMYFSSEYESETVDLKKLKVDHPDLYDSLKSLGYVKVSKTDEKFTVKVKSVLNEKEVT